MGDVFEDQDDISFEYRKPDEKAKRERAKANGSGANDNRTQSSLAYFITSAEFVGGFVPPEYIVDGIMLKAFLYSCTGLTGSGKTLVFLQLAMGVGHTGKFV